MIITPFLAAPAPSGGGGGVPAGGTTGQVLAKASNTDFDVEFITPSGGGGGITSFNEMKTIVFDGQGSTPAVDSRTFIYFPYAATITRWTIFAYDAAGLPVTASAVVDIWDDTYANYPPTVADTITASAKPTLTAANRAQSSTLTGWATSISANDVLAFNLDSVSTATKIVMNLEVTRA
jgi:hypothetical protein